MGFREKANNFIRKIEDFILVRAIRNGLVRIIPVLIIGAFALILQTFPVPAYQEFLTNNDFGSFLLKFFTIINKATFGVLSLYMTYAISHAYMTLKTDSRVMKGGAIIASLISFFILAGVDIADFSLDQMGPKSMFLAILSGLGASALYLFFFNLIQNHRRSRFLASSDSEFNKMTTALIPIAIVALIFALFNTVITRVFNVDSFRVLIANAFSALFSIGTVDFFKGFFFVFLSSLMWFFGIHGSDILEGVMQEYFVPGLAANQAGASNILTKEFFDCFVLMGGCGATICLLIAILAFSRNRSRKNLGITASIPMIFNINELMVFGLPIIFNPVMLIPFLTVPLVCYSVSYLAIATGMVPVITNSVEWTTPILLGGYTATGSIAGLILQLINVHIGVAIYFPFVRILDRRTNENAKKHYEDFVTYFKENEKDLVGKNLISLGNIHSDYAKDLSNDIRFGLDKYLVLYYQPQYDYEGNRVGVEALLRFNHPVIGILYPPLVIKLAEEGDFLDILEEKVISRALQDRPDVLKQFGEGIELSVNVTGTTVVTNKYINYVKELNEADPFKGKNFCIEITEQAAISFDETTKKALKSLRQMGIHLAIDDFSMGQTSINYLKDNLFDIIKLDGSLVSSLVTSNNTKDIISSIVKLAKSLKLSVIAEFVDTEEKKQSLHDVGCDIYQGYLYSTAIPLEKTK